MKNQLFILCSGSRSINSKNFLTTNLYNICVGKKWFRDYEKIIFVGGGCEKGLDSILKDFARSYDCGYKEFPANWEKFGKSAGFIRNMEMIKFVQQQENYVCVCFWDGKSKGCKHVIDNWGDNDTIVILKKEKIELISK